MKDIWIPLSGAMAQQKNVETIANNIANANTPGFKKDQQIFKEYLTSLNKENEAPGLPQKEWRPEDFYRSQGVENGYVKADGSYTVFEQGPLVPTGNPLDFNIQGSGLFEILGPNGIEYTRKGIFSISKEGKLVTDQGYLVLSKIDPNTLNANTALKDGAPPPAPIPQPNERAITFGQGNISVNLQGEIYQNNKLIGQLSVVEFKDINALKKEGNSLYLNPDNSNIEKGDVKSSIQQGFYEGSNVNAVTEMSNLIKANRHFESLQKAMKAYDMMSEKGVTEIAKF